MRYNRKIKFVAFVLLFTLFFNITSWDSSQNWGIKKAEAGFFDDVANYITAAATSFYSVFKTILESKNIIVQSFVAIAKKRILDRMVDDLVRWIQNGETPRFVNNFGGLIEDAAQAAIGDVAQEIGLADICAPFKLRLQTQITRVQLLSQKVSCTLDKIIGNFEQFAADFQTGGWIGYQELMKPQNNRWGAEIILQNELIERQAKQVAAAKEEAQAGQGFLSQTRCLEWTYFSNDEKISIGYDTAITFSWQDVGGNIRGTYPTPGEKSKVTFYRDGGEIAKDTIKCTQEQTITPGKAIGDAASQALFKTDIDFLINNEDISRYIAAIVDAGIYRLTKEAVSGLRDMTKGNDNSPTRGGSDYTLPGDIQTDLNNLTSAEDDIKNYVDASSEEAKDIKNDLDESGSEAMTDIINKTSATLDKSLLENSQLMDTLNNTDPNKGLINCLNTKGDPNSRLSWANTTLTKAQGEYSNKITEYKTQWDSLKVLVDASTPPSGLFTTIKSFERNVNDLDAKISDDLGTANNYLKDCKG